MYLPSEDFQLQALPDIVTDGLPEAIDNVTKSIERLLRVCSNAGLDEHGFGCGMSIAVVLGLLAALLLAVIVFVIPAMLGLIGSIVVLIGNVILAIVAGILAVIMGILKLAGKIVSTVFATMMNIISLPCRPCLRSQAATSPFDAQQPQQSQNASGVTSGSIHYARESSSCPEIFVRPPSYHSDDEYSYPSATGRK